MSEEEHEIVVRDGRPYLRRVPYTRENPTRAQRRTRAIFGLASYKARDQFGKTTIIKDGEEKEAAYPWKSVRDEMKGMKIAGRKEKKAMAYKHLVLDAEKLKALLEALARSR